MQRAADGKGKAEMQMQIETNKTTKGIQHMVWPAGRCTHMLDIVHRTPDRSVWFALMASRSVGALANYRSYNILFRVFLGLQIYNKKETNLFEPYRGVIRAMIMLEPAPELQPTDFPDVTDIRVLVCVWLSKAHMKLLLRALCLKPCQH